MVQKLTGMTIANRLTGVRKLTGLALFSLVLLLPGLAAAQTAPRWEVFGGYSYRRMDTPSLGYADYSNLQGWNAAGAFNITPTWSVALDLSGHYGSHLSVFNYMIGPQFNWRRDKSKVFVHGLFGKAQNHVDVANGTVNGIKSVGRALDAGAGYDWDYSPKFTIRVVQADFINTNTFGTNQNDLRVSVGLIFHFGQIGHRPKL
jgi:hypothetical protein